jgi:hypothetical protein
VPGTRSSLLKRKFTPNCRNAARSRPNNIRRKVQSGLAAVLTDHHLERCTIYCRYLCGAGFCPWTWLIKSKSYRSHYYTHGRLLQRPPIHLQSEGSWSSLLGLGCDMRLSSRSLFSRCNQTATLAPSFLASFETSQQQWSRYVYNAAMMARRHD